MKMNGSILYDDLKMKNLIEIVEINNTISHINEKEQKMLDKELKQ
jgi:hypothetical protein